MRQISQIKMIALFMSFATNFTNFYKLLFKIILACGKKKSFVICAICGKKICVIRGKRTAKKIILICEICGKKISGNSCNSWQQLFRQLVKICNNLINKTQFKIDYFCKN